MRPQTPRRTKIVCTLGPATSEPQRIGGLISAGMNVARINRSHGSQEEAAYLIRTVREQATRLGEHVAVMLDLRGPKMRTGRLAGGRPVVLADRSEVVITTRDVEGNAALISTDYADLPREVAPGDRVLLSDGLIELQVLGVSDSEVATQVVHGGVLAEHQGINLPGTAVRAPALTEKDRDDLAFGVAQGVDYIALSFVRRPEDVEEANALVHDLGADIPVIAKIEKPQALDHLDGILRVSGGVMVARGDMGIEMPPEEVPLRQKQIIMAANQAEVPVITATQMLESMIHRPRPTRAEANDVANAIWDGTDAVMLSGETAIGDFPLESVMMMDRIARAAEGDPRYIPEIQRPHRHPGFTHALAMAARQIASDDAGIQAIAAFTRSGATARFISEDRPAVPILGYTASPGSARRMALYWGVTPIVGEEVSTVGGMFDAVEQAARDLPFLSDGDALVILGRIALDTAGVTNFLTLHRIGAPRPPA